MRAALLLVVAVTTPGIGALPQAQEKLIAVVPDGIELAGPSITGPDGKKISDVSRVVFRPDGGQVAYAGFKGGRSCPVIGTTVGEPFDYLSDPMFGGDHVFFRAGNRTSPTTEKWWIYADGKKTGEEDWIGEIASNADGSLLAYWVQPRAKIDVSGSYSRTNLQLVVGTRRGAKWQDAEAVIPPVFSPDGKRVATVAMKGSKWFPLVASTKTEESRGTGYGLMSGVAWRPDGQEIACAAVEAGDAAGALPGMKFVIVCGKDVLGKRYECAGCPVFSPDGKNIAYKVLKGGKLGIAVGADDSVEPRFDYVGRPVFSPSGSEAAYAASVGATADPFVVVGESADSGAEGGDWFVMNGAKKGDVFRKVGQPVFSRDGKRLAYPALMGGKWFIVVDKTKSAPFDEVASPVFSADGKQVSFGARLGRELWWKVLTLE